MVDDETPKNCGGGGGHVLALCRALSSSGALSSTNRRPSTERHRIEIEKAPMDDLKHGIDSRDVRLRAWRSDLPEGSRPSLRRP